ncbi:unnamed protein product [Rangifer tarandus platyrhynchus]|uniref:Uncharacterized protein n=1 Tax=Rangifer tarandus platyrhynchus TaxID=3082113 RepID=A0AC59ZGS6_RANTA
MLCVKVMTDAQMLSSHGDHQRQQVTRVRAEQDARARSHQQLKAHGRTRKHVREKGKGEAFHAPFNTEAPPSPLVAEIGIRCPGLHGFSITFLEYATVTGHRAELTSIPLEHGAMQVLPSPYILGGKDRTFLPEESGRTPKGPFLRGTGMPATLLG